MFPFSLMGWVGLCLLFLALGLFLGNIVLLAGALFLLLTVLLATMLQPPEKIEAHRKLPREICWAGDDMEVERKLTLAGGTGAVFVHDSLPAEIEVVEGNNFHLLWKWPGYREFNLSYRVRFDKREELILPPPTWTSQAPFWDTATQYSSCWTRYNRICCAQNPRHHATQRDSRCHQTASLSGRSLPDWNCQL